MNYKVALIKEYGKKVEIQEFKNKNEAISTYLEMVNEIYKNHDLLRKFIRVDDEIIMRGDLIFCIENNHNSTYVILIGDDLNETRRTGKYKQIMKKYINHLI